MKTKTLLYFASGLIFFTFLGHTIGAVMPVPNEQTERLQIFEQMKHPVINMPGAPLRSYLDFLNGANFSLSVYLFITGLFFILMARDYSKNQRISLLVHSTGLLSVSIISFIYFFSVPAICLGVAALVGLFATTRNETI